MFQLERKNQHGHLNILQIFKTTPCDYKVLLPAFPSLSCGLTGSSLSCCRFIGFKKAHRVVSETSTKDSAVALCNDIYAVTPCVPWLHSLLRCCMKRLEGELSLTHSFRKLLLWSNCLLSNLLIDTVSPHETTVSTKKILFILLGNYASFGSKLMLPT